MQAVILNNNCKHPDDSALQASPGSHQYDPYSSMKLAVYPSIDDKNMVQS